MQDLITSLLTQVRQAIEKLSDTQYTTPVGLLSKATIGQHVRHVVEFYLELEKGYSNGMVNYDQRRRDLRIETSRQAAIGILAEVGLTVGRPDKEMSLAADLGSGAPVMVSTNYFRELIYNIEHTVHHMALIRVGISAVSEIALPERFGVAVSTLKHRQVCAQ